MTPHQSPAVGAVHVANRRRLNFFRQADNHDKTTLKQSP